MELRFLDKDLDRIANAESAGFYSGRPVRQLGVALVFAALATVAGATLTGAGGSAMLAAGVMVGAFLALSIGANDTANAMGPAVGAGAISMRAGLALVAVAEIAGALTAGARVSATLTSDILPAAGAGGADAAAVMLAAMIAAAIWITLATWAGAPVSTTHAVVGGIAGAGAAQFGLDAPHWGGIARIAAGWLVSPVIAGAIGAALLALLRARIHRAPDRISAGVRWLPVLVGAVAAVLGGYALTLGPVRWWAALPLSALAAVAGWWLARRRLRAERLAGRRPREVTERLFGPPLIAAAVLIAFAHGANDVGNVVGPLSVIARQGNGGAEVTPTWLAMGGLGFGLGAMLFGRRLVAMVGSRITRLNPARALCVALATALVLLGATWLGLPVSSTHVALGGVFGVGFYREWDERRMAAAAAPAARAPLPPEEAHRRRLVRRSAVLRTLAAWAVTVPSTALLGAGLAWAIA